MTFHKASGEAHHLSTQDITALAQRRAESLGLAWGELSAAHQDGIRETIVAELNWDD